MKTPINTPDLSLPGGVANHYKGLQPFWSEPVKYNYIGGRKGFPGPIILVFDIIKFFFLCTIGKYDVILLNPSLGKTALKRDALFLKIAKWFNIKTVVFFHGWDDFTAKKFDDNSSQFAKDYQKSDHIIVLATIFKEKILKWGVKCPIHLSTTKVDNQLIRQFDINKKTYNQNILFLARIEKNKGIMIALKAFVIVLKNYPEATFTVAGSGGALEYAKKWVKINNIKNVYFSGNVSGENLRAIFVRGSIYVLPTTHGEGMPTSVLEAMAFGLPIISRPVGGLVDFFKNEKMGYLIESLNPNDYAEKIMMLFNNLTKYKAIGTYNHDYAKEHFMASKVAIDIEKILRK